MKPLARRRPRSHQTFMRSGLRAGSAAAFSLVELMIVVAVISVLASLAMTKASVFMIKARQAEAKTNLRAIRSLALSYAAENDVFPNASETIAGWGTQMGFTLDTDVNCNISNLIGFTISDCKKARYFYYAFFKPLGPQFHAEAINRAAKVCPPQGGDIWYIYGSDGLICHLHSAQKSNCKSVWPPDSLPVTGDPCSRAPWW